MRFVKLTVISAIIFFIILLVISLWIPFHIRISRAININEPKVEIYKLVGNLEEWKKWNEMIGKGVAVSIIFSSTDSVISVWNKKNSDEVRSGFNLIESSPAVSVVQWYFDFHLKWYPWEKLKSILYDKQLGPPMEKSLQNLKNLVEKNP
jgi:hypothetical protein